ncbi:uncharacterized protein [Temnothorax nylanderi]|uniref:uncharacterized protein isoform X2 n=1 Tax=Temnothorax nylanderi TaxID=102681 RepID=UPI003A885A14
MSQENATQNRPSERKKRRNSERLGVQLYDTRESFGTIADKHAEAMKMLAEAMKLQADATLQISSAIDKMARNEDRQTQILEIIYKCLKD